ncbi:MAG TPA: hypothetical protein VIR27_21110 [Mycobacteriales bacterium]
MSRARRRRTANGGTGGPAPERAAGWFGWRQGVHHRRQRRRCERLARAVPLPTPFTPATFVQAVAEMRHRSIELIPVTGGVEMPTGLVVSTDGADYIVYTADTTRLHRWQIVAHEVGHLLCGHRHGLALSETVSALLTPNLSVELVRRVLGRTTYEQWEEREAELFAYAIVRRALRVSPPPDEPTPDLTEEMTRLGSVLDPRRNTDGRNS